MLLDRSLIRLSIDAYCLTTLPKLLSVDHRLDKIIFLNLFLTDYEQIQFALDSVLALLLNCAFLHSIDFHIIFFNIFKS